MKIKKKIIENKIFFITFSALLLDLVMWLLTVDIHDAVDNYYYPMYVINYSIGFCSRALIGSIISLFTDTVNVTVLTICLICFHIVACFFISLFINGCMKKCDSKLLYVFILIVLLSPIFTVFLRYMGIMDIFWLLGTIACVCIADKKFIRWIIPLICTLCLATHNAYVLTYLPVVLIIVMYQYIKKPSVGNLIFIVSCFILTGAASVYFVLVGDSTIKLTESELLSYVRGRLTGGGFDETYILFSLYGKVPGIENVQGFGNYLKFMFEFTTTNMDKGWYIYFTVITAAACAPIYAIITGMIKKAEKLNEKFVYACSYLFIPLSVLAALLSTDTDRYSSSLVLSLILLIMYFIRTGNKNFKERLDSFTAKINEKKALYIIVAVLICKYIFTGVQI